MSWELRSLTAINRSPLNAVVTTLERPGAHWAVRMPYQNLAADRRARLQAFVSSARGHAQRFYVPVYGWTRRGSFPATELLTNGDFADGTTGWTHYNSTLTASDGVLRAQSDGETTDFGITRASISPVVQYAPYVLRAMFSGSLTFTDQLIAEIQSAGITANQALSARQGLISIASVLAGTSVTAVYGFHNSGGGLRASRYLDISLMSLSRCALVDNGINAATHANALSNAAWTKSEITIGDDILAGPDGVADADGMTPSTNSAEHYITRNYSKTAAAQDIVMYGVFQAAGYDFVQLALSGGTGSAFCTFDVSSGAAGVVGESGDWSNARVVVKPLGGDWYLLELVARSSAAVTTYATTYYVGSGSSTFTYAGDGSSGVRAALLGSGLSSSFVRPVKTTTTAVASGTSQTGSALHLKGLPASTNGLLLKGDPVEIITGSTSQLVRTRTALNSDAAGLGYFEFEPPLRISPSDNAAVIIHNPMCRMMMENNVNGWTDRIGGFSDLEFAAMEDTYP